MPITLALKLLSFNALLAGDRRQIDKGIAGDPAEIDAAGLIDVRPPEPTNIVITAQELTEDQRQIDDCIVRDQTELQSFVTPASPEDPKPWTLSPFLNRSFQFGVCEALVFAIAIGALL